MMGPGAEGPWVTVTVSLLCPVSLHQKSKSREGKASSSREPGSSCLISAHKAMQGCRVAVPCKAWPCPAFTRLQLCAVCRRGWTEAWGWHVVGVHSKEVDGPYIAQGRQQESAGNNQGPWCPGKRETTGLWRKAMEMGREALVARARFPRAWGVEVTVGARGNS